MIEGTVDDDGVPIILLVANDQSQAMIVDTGFNGDLELPETFRSAVNPRFLTRIRSVLAGGLSIEEDLFLVTLPFDGRLAEMEATFTNEPLGLVGTHLLREYRLDVDFVERALRLERIGDSSG